MKRSAVLVSVISLLFACVPGKVGDQSGSDEVAEIGTETTSSGDRVVTAPTGQSLRLTKNTFSHDVEVELATLEQKEYVELLAEDDYELEMEEGVILVETSRISLGVKKDEAFNLTESLIYTLPAAALPAAALPAASIPQALPAAALPSALYLATPSLTPSPLLYAIATTYDPDGQPYGSPFNALLSYDEVKAELVIIIEPERLAFDTFKGGSVIIFSLFLVPDGRKAILNGVELKDYPYSQQKAKRIEILSVRGDGGEPGTFASSLLIEAENFGPGDSILLRDVMAEKRVNLAFVIGPDGIISADLPADLEPGRYQLKLLGIAGSDKKEIEILKGEPGIGIVWQGELDEPPENPQLNWAYYDTGTSTAYLYDGSDWTFMVRSGYDGQDGESGPQGPEGRQGPQGEQGPLGSTGPSGISISWVGGLPSAPADPKLNDAYYDQVDRISYIYDGTAWRILAQDGLAGPQGEPGFMGDPGPEGPEGQQGLPGLSLFWLGEASDDPADPELNWAYYNTGSGASYVWDGFSWQILAIDGRAGEPGQQGMEGPMGPAGIAGQQGPTGTDGISLIWLGTLTDDPIAPTTNQAYHNSVDNISYVFDGDSWEILAQDGTPGPQGSIGQQGTQGPTGATGATGATGSNGISLSWRGSFATAPSSPQLNWAYYNTTAKTSYVYDGSAWQILAINGAIGATGSQGPTGATGSTGAQGPSGYRALVSTVDETPGSNCATGGKLVQSGVDDGSPSGTAGDGVLQSSEIDSSAYLCNGAIGATGATGGQGTAGFNSLVATAGEPIGTNCTYGGTKVQFGVDNGDGGATAADGILQNGEVDAVGYVCKQYPPDLIAPLFDGANALEVASSTSLTVHWLPGWDNQSPISTLKYRVYLATSSGAQNFSSYTAETTAGAASYTLSGLSSTTTYYIVVSAVDQAGNEDSNTAEISGTPLDLSPPTFSGITGITVLSDNSLRLNWSAGSDDTSTAGQLSYMIYQATASGGQNFSAPTYTSPVGVTNFTVTGLLAGTTYYFVIRARDAALNNETNTVELGKAPHETIAPTFAGITSATALSPTSLRLDWSAGSDDQTVPGSLVYLIYLATTSGGQNYTTPSYTSTAGATSYSVSGLSTGSTYYLVVRCRDAAANNDTNTVQRQVTLTADAAPSFAGLSSGIYQPPNSVRLQWSQASDDYTAQGVLVYTIYLATVSGGHNFASPNYTTAAGASEYTVPGLSVDTVYFFVVRVRDGSGNIDQNTIERRVSTGSVLTPTVVTLDSIDGGNNGLYNSMAHDSQGHVHIASYNATTKNLEYITDSSGSFVVTPLDRKGDVGLYTSLAIDENDKVHIAYYDSGNSDLRYISNASGSWIKQVLDSAGDVGKYSSIVFDGSGYLHLAYYDATNTRLKYLTDKTGSFQIEVVDSGNVGQYASLAVDDNANVHIAYYDAAGLDLKYAKYSLGSWSIQTIASTNDVGQYASLGIDAARKVHVAYYDATNADLRYITNASGSWVASTVDSAGGVGQYASLAISGAGAIQIAYYDASNTDLKYATFSGAWSILRGSDTDSVGQYARIALNTAGSPSFCYYDATTKDLKFSKGFATTIDSTGTVGAYTSLALDSSGMVHISYYDSTYADLKYATNALGSWVTTTVDLTGSVGASTSLALGGSGKVHISYRDSTNGDLKYATNASGSWVATTIDSTGSADPFTSLALDGSGKVHISYRDSTNADLKYATNASGSWVATTIDSTGNVGSSTSLALDAAGKAHISYRDDTNADLKYATNTSGSWVRTTIDSTGSVGSYTSLALDGSGRVHISYCDGINYDLKYATNASGSWVATTIDSTGYVGYYTSLALDGSGRVHISYYDQTNFDLKYATNASGSWVATTIDSTGSVGSYTSLALDGSGRVHISYWDETNYDLKYALGPSAIASLIDSSALTGTHTALALDSAGKRHLVYYDQLNYNLEYLTDRSGTWQASTLASAGTVGQYNSVAVDSNEALHLAGYDGTVADLIVRTNASGSFVATTVDSTGNVGQYGSIGLDVNDARYVAYYDVTNGDLKSANDSSGVWVTSAVDTGGNVGMYASLVVVPETGKQHIAYYDVTNADLKYATNSSGSWVVTTLDSVGNVGQYASLGRDSTGSLHIAYYDATNLALKYATNESGSWTIEVVADQADIGRYAALTIDGNDVVHILSYDNTNKSLRYSTNLSGAFVSYTISDPENGQGMYPALDVDSNNVLHIAFHSEDSGELLFTTLDPYNEL